MARRPTQHAHTQAHTPTRWPPRHARARRARQDARAPHRRRPVWRAQQDARAPHMDVAWRARHAARTPHAGAARRAQHDAHARAPHDGWHAARNVVRAAPHAIGARDAPRARPCPPKAEKSPEASRTFYDGRDDSGRLQKTRERPRRGWNAREQPGWPMSVRAQPRSLQTRPEASMSVQRHTMTVRSVM
uniref:Uncharacterized protein n=1 Tax=Cucumis melo TaxID=3656 RepID=A0A9I9CCE0_CUCME